MGRFRIDETKDTSLEPQCAQQTVRSPNTVRLDLCTDCRRGEEPLMKPPAANRGNQEVIISQRTPSSRGTEGSTEVTCSSEENERWLILWSPLSDEFMLISETKSNN